MIIGIDIDETITNTHKDVMDYVNKNTPELKVTTYDDLIKYNIEYLKNNIETIQKDLTLKSNFITALNKFKIKGYKIILITARGSKYDYDYKTSTEEFLKKNNIIVDKIIYKSKDKGYDAKKENIDIFIDDKEQNLDKVSSKQIKCIRFCDDINTRSKYPVFNDWNKIEEYIDQIQ